jgi:hypothetical protein
MLKLHPIFLKKNGRKEFVILPYEEFKAIQELLEDFEDIVLLEQARDRNAGAPGYSSEEVRRRFTLRKSSRSRLSTRQK